MRFIKKFVCKETAIAICAILSMAILTHGIRLGELGFYYDDWYVLWSGAARGPISLVGLFITDRPAIGLLYFLTYRVLGDSLLGWHLYALAWRAIGALTFFWIIRIVWPQRRFLSTLAAILFVVYPAFLSEPNALTKVNHLTAFGLAMSSMALMLAGVTSTKRKTAILLELLALAAGSAYVWIYEYMIGLEAMRLALLALVFHKKGVKSVGSIVKAIAVRYWPYVMTLSGFLYWRFFVFTSSRPATNVENLAGSYGSDPLYMGTRIVFQTLLDFLSVTLFAWFAKLYQFLSHVEYSRIAVAVLVGCTGLLVIILYRYYSGNKHEHGNNGDPDRRTALEMAMVGLVGTIFAILPVVVLNRSIDLMDAYKSYGLHPSTGAILVVMSVLLLLSLKTRTVILFSLLFLSLGTNSLNIDYWKSLWQVERSMWWQVTWRVPDFTNDTFVMVYAPEGYHYMQDYEIWGPINLIYRPGLYKAPTIQSEVLNETTLPFVKNRNEADRYVRNIFVNRDFGNLLMISQPSLDSCVHIIDRKMPAYSAMERAIVQQAGITSDLERIQTEAASPTPPRAIFGPEPAHDWCYFYQKASLARQKGDWQAVLELYDEAQKQGLQPVDKSEYFPFIEALVNGGRMVEARSLNEDMIQTDPVLRASLCDSLKADPGYPPGFNYDYTSIRILICGN